MGRLGAVEVVVEGGEACVFPISRLIEVDCLTIFKSLDDGFCESDLCLFCSHLVGAQLYL